MSTLRLQPGKRFIGDGRTSGCFSPAGLQPGIHQVVFVAGVVEIVQPGKPEKMCS
jgi:hypothetical protein